MFGFKSLADLLAPRSGQGKSFDEAAAQSTARIDAVLKRNTVRQAAAEAPQRQDAAIQQRIANFLRRKEEFLNAIGPDMRFGIDAQASSERFYDPDLSKQWDERLKAMSPAERGRFFIDWVHYSQLFAHSAKGENWGPRTNYFSVYLPGSVNDGSIFKEAVEFTEAQAVEFLNRCVSACELRSRFDVRDPRRIVRALKQVLTQPDEGLASRLRNGGYELRWAEPLLKTLCPLEAAATKASASKSQSKPASVSKEERAADEKLQVLQSTLARLPGMWIAVPVMPDRFWENHNCQMFPCFAEVSTYLDSVEHAASMGHDMSEHKERLAALRQLPQESCRAGERQRSPGVDQGYLHAFPGQ